MLLIDRNCRPSQDETLDFARDQRLGTRMTRQERLPRSRRSRAYDYGNGRIQEVYVFLLCERARAQHLFFLGLYTLRWTDLRSE